jgi:1,4-alpha-glucan branching enzyme
LLDRLHRPRTKRQLLVVLNMTPVVREGYCVGFPQGGFWREVVNSDASVYGGSNQGNLGGVKPEAIAKHGQPYSATLNMPPLSVEVFKHEPA